MRTALLAVLLLVPTVLAVDDGPAVVLLVRTEGPGLRVDGARATTAGLEDAVRARLSEAAPATLDAARDGTRLRVGILSAVGVPAVAHVAGVVDGLVSGEDDVDVSLPAGTRVEAFLPAPEGRAVVWVVAGDDPTGRFAPGEVLQALFLDGDSASRTSRAVLVEASRCPACGDEAAARAVASAFAAGLPPRDGYLREPTAREAALSALFVAVAAAVLVPWRRRA